MKIIGLTLLAGMLTMTAAAEIGFGGAGKSLVFQIAEPEKKITLSGVNGEAVWKLYDFWQRTAAEGTVNKLSPVITITVKEPGYYRLVVHNGKEIAETGIAIVGVPPVQRNLLFGVGTHFAQHWDTWLIPIIKNAGFSGVRDECYWQSAEKEKGRLDFNFDTARRLEKVSQELDVMLCLSYGNPFYDNFSAPTSAEGLSGWKNYVRGAAAAFPQIKTFETWNEYNCGFNMYGRTIPSPENYMLLLKATREELKKCRSSAELVGCSATTLPFEWLEKVFALGGLEYMDSVSVHPYRWGEWQKNPETLYPDMMRLRQMVDKYANGRKIPIHATELGWPVDWKYRVSDAKQAAYIVRTFANLQRAGVERAIWYSFMKPPHDPEQFAIGELIPGNNYSPRPAYAAIAVMTRELDGSQYQGEEKIPAPALCMKYRRDNRDIRMLWNPEMVPMTLAINADKPLTLIDIMGGKHQLTPVNGKVYLMIGQLPVYLHGDIGPVSLSKDISAAISTMETAVSTPFQFKLNGTEGLSLSVDGEVFTPGQQVTMMRNDQIGTRNAIGDIRKGETNCGFFCMSYDVLTQLSINAVRLMPGRKLRVEIGNILPGQIQVISGFEGKFDGAALPVPEKKKLDIAAVTYISLPVQKQASLYDLKPVSLRFDFSSHPTLICEAMLGNNSCFFRGNAKMDGNLSEWRNQPYIDLRKQGKYVKCAGQEEDVGPEKFNGKIWLGWDLKRLYIAAEIIDETHKQVFPVWDGDSIQIGIGKVFPADADTSFEAELAFNGIKDSWVFPGRSPLGFDGGAIRQYSEPLMTRKGNTTIYEVAIPWEKIRFAKPADGAFRFSIVVNNNNGKGRMGWLEWGGGIGSGKNPERYQIISFVR